MKKSIFYGWKLLAAFWVIYFINLAFPTYGSSVINAYMADGLHLDRKMLGSAYALYQLMVGLPGPLIAYCVNRIGSRRTLVLGSLLVLAGSLIMATLVHAGWQAVVVFGIVIGLGSAAGGSIAQQASIAVWFERRRALALSIMYSSGGIGGFLAAPFLNRLIENAGGDWRLGWWTIAGLAVVSALLSALFVKERPSDLGQFPDGVSENDASTAASGRASTRKGGVYRTRDVWGFGEALRSRAFALLMIAQLGISAGFAMFMAHGVVHLKDLGHSPGAAAMAVSVLVGSTLIGKLAGAFGDRIEPRYFWAGALACFGAGTALVINAHGSVYPFAILMGCGWGASLVSFMAVPMNYYGPKAYASILGIMLAVQTTMGGISPLVAGYLFDAYGSYTPAFYAISIWCFAGVVLLLMATPPERKTEIVDRAPQPALTTR